MRKVFLHGRLGKKFGKEWNLEVSSPAEAIRAIETITHKLYDYLKRSTDRLVGYKVVIGKRAVKETVELLFNFDNEDEFHFYPVPVGAASAQKSASVWQIIIGVILIIVGLVLTFGSYGSLSPYGVPMIMSGIGMVLGGVAGLLVKPPSVDTKEKQFDGSYLFSGQVNTNRQGGPIPIGYGEMIIGSQTVSLSIRTEKISVYSPVWANYIPNGSSQWSPSGG